MWALLKGVVLTALSLLVAALAFIGISPETAHAPEDFLSTPITPAPAMVSEEVSSLDGTGGGPLAENDSLYQGPDVTFKGALDVLTNLKPPGSSPPAPTVDINGVARAAVVNILCTTAGAGPFNPISASGVIIDPSGIILTNAHVAQYFLLKEYPRPGFVECIARTGSPATPAYTLDLLFISPTWVANNAHKIDDQTPTGNGEHDYALLKVAGFVAAPDIAAPAEFPYLSLVLASPKLGDTVLLAGYPAGFLGGITIQKDLYAVSAPAKVEALYTFTAGTADLFSIGGSIVAQQGASGGAVAVERAQSPNGVAIVGLITTSSDAPDTGSRDLRALSTEYIIRDFASERGIPLADYLGHDLSAERRLFEQNTAPALTNALVSVLER